MSLLFRLLRENINYWQFGGFAIANAIGAFIVLCGLQAYNDMNLVFSQEDSFMAENHIVISKPVNMLTTMTSALGVKAGFTEEEIKDITVQKGVTSVGGFTAAHFDVAGMVAFKGMGFTSQMFLEAVPDEFLDLPDGKSSEWKARVDDGFVPVVLPQTYLNLYNYGFASSQGLPQIAESIVTKFPLQLRLSGGGEVHNYEARVVAFTKRLNTILVPESFLKEANRRMAADKADEYPSRVIIATSTKELATSSSSSLLGYLAEKGYEIEGNSADTLRMQTLTHGIVVAVIAIGLLVSVLSFFLLIVSIHLLIEKNREKIENLYVLGFRVGQMAWPYQALAIVLDVFTWTVAAVLTIVIYPKFSTVLVSTIPGYIPSPLVVRTLVAATIIATMFALLHLVAIRKKVGDNR